MKNNRVEEGRCYIATILEYKNMSGVGIDPKRIGMFQSQDEYEQVFYWHGKSSYK